MKRTISFGLIVAALAACGGAPAAPASELPAGQSRPTAATSTEIPSAATPAAAAPTEIPPASATPTEIPAANPPAGAATPPPADPDAPNLVFAAPAAGAMLQSPARIAGAFEFGPYEGWLGVEVWDAEGNQLGRGGIQASAGNGDPGDFEGEIGWHPPAAATAGRIVVYDESPADGSHMSEATLPVTLLGSEQRGFYLALPAPDAVASPPLHVEALGVEAGAPYALRLTFASGETMETRAIAVPHGAGGAVAANLTWEAEGAPPQPAETEATLEIIDQAGAVLGSGKVNVYDQRFDELTMPIKLYFADGEELVEVTRYVPRTQAVALAALRELSWGPAGVESTMRGLRSALPSPEEVAAFPGREADWRPRARVQSVRIEHGVAYVDWSKEMKAWGGGSARLGLLNRQVKQTLFQFPSITDVVMTVDGSADVLQP
ncbi:MAG TPA: GerMN domain-containing protein [Herpetosiphonaceae bacterium]